MKIIQLVPLITPEGAFGGPVRVAVNQTRALRSLGHDVTLVAGARGYGRQLPTSFDGIEVELFPAKYLIPGIGYAGLGSPGAFRFLIKALRDADVFHIHAARDFLTLPMARVASSLGVPYILQGHGMIDPSGHPLAYPLDLAWTRPALLKAARVLYLTNEEKDGLTATARGPLNLEQLDNGVPQFSSERPADGAPLEVIYLARLHARKRPLDFVRMAIQLQPKYPNVHFALIGPDEGEGPAVRRLIESAGMDETIRWEGPISPETTLSRLAQAQLYVQPSIHETFPMSVLEAMSLGKPVVVRRSCGLATAIEESGAGVVAGDEFDDLVRTVDGLLGSPHRLKQMQTAAKFAVATRFSIEAVARRLETLYAAAV